MKTEFKTEAQALVEWGIKNGLIYRPDYTFNESKISTIKRQEWERNKGIIRPNLAIQS